MTKINLAKRSTLTVDEFRTWLNQLIQDKKGALPDLNDWKLIKEHLDKVGKQVDCRSEDSSAEYTGLDAEPYDLEFMIHLLNTLCREIESEYDTVKQLEHNSFPADIMKEVAYFQKKIWESIAIPKSYMLNEKEYENGKTKTESSR